MSVVISGCPSGLYAAAQDHAVSQAGIGLRDSLREALAPPTRSPRIELLFERIDAALRKAKSIEGVCVDVSSFARMCDLIAVLPDTQPLPEIVVESENEIGLDWHIAPRRTLTITVSQTPYVGFAALFGHEPLYGRTPFTGTLPETLAYLLGRLNGGESAGEQI